jgi:hypothetical protein
MLGHVIVCLLFRPEHILARVLQFEELIKVTTLSQMEKS